MDRVYRCPICGKSYTSLEDMYNCARTCEAKELAKESKIETERKDAEQKILSKYEELKVEIHNYNVKYSPNSFDLFMKHQGQTLADNEVLRKMKDIKPALNYPKKNSHSSLENFLRRELEIQKIREDIDNAKLSLFSLLE